MPLQFHALSQDRIAAARAGAPDANGLPPETKRSPGAGTPCRCCLSTVPEGDETLVLAARPFDTIHPYAEVGPIFLCAKECTPFDQPGAPPILSVSASYLLKGYGRDDRIVYGSGQITPQAEVESYATALLSRPDIAYVDVRSASNNCWLTRITMTATGDSNGSAL